MAGWSARDVPDQSGRTHVITGGNSGIGLEAARGLAAAGARVVLACRNPDKASAAVDDLRATVPDAQVETQTLDLASLESVRNAAAELRERWPKIDVLINNAGVMALPRRLTADGFEMQIGTNHLGHFALTGLLIDRVADRVVNVASHAHRIGRLRLDDLHGERRYGRWSAYGQSKLANLLFTYELQRRLDAVGSPLRSAACHPGWASTNLQYVAPEMDGRPWQVSIMRVLNGTLAQDAVGGALPTLYAASAADVGRGEYFGPDGFQQMWGSPRRVGSTRAARDRDDARALWERSVELTGVDFSALGGADVEVAS